jgi:hypothetical protein
MTIRHKRAHFPPRIVVAAGGPVTSARVVCRHDLVLLFAQVNGNRGEAGRDWKHLTRVGVRDRRPLGT